MDLSRRFFNFGLEAEIWGTPRAPLGTPKSSKKIFLKIFFFDGIRPIGVFFDMFSRFLPEKNYFGTNSATLKGKGGIWVFRRCSSNVTPLLTLLN